MTDSLIRSIVEAIHSTPTQAVLYFSGGATQLLGWLGSVPGASNTLLEVIVPYSRMSLIHLLGKVPIQFTSKDTAEDMALLAYNRALKLSKPGSPVVGVGFTGSLATSRSKLGDHRFYVSTRTSDRLWASSVTLSKGLRSREQEDRVSSQVLLKAIADACKVSSSTTYVSDLTENEVPDVSEQCFSEDQELEQLINGKICFKVFPFSSGIQTASGERKVILSGSFNPLHDGHLKLLEVAMSLCTDGYPCFELSAINADKPPLTVAQVKDRVKQFEKAGKTVIISNQPYFYKKAELFPGSAFVIGADTAARLINPKYYGGSYDNMIETLLGCKNTGCTFLVGGRNMDGVFKILEDFDIPDELKEMFISIPVHKFRMDISSTELRKNQGVVGAFYKKLEDLRSLIFFHNTIEKGDKKQQEPLRTSEEITENFWPVEALHTSHESIHEAGNYFDVVKVLSEVELPSPSPVLATEGTSTRETNVTTFHEGQSSGTKRKADDTEVNVEREREQKTKQHHYVQHGHQRGATSTTDKHRRNRISERIRALKALLPNCIKRDKASILGDAIEYIKYLQMQVQMMQSMGVGPVSQVPYMFQARQPSLQEPNLSPYFTTRPLISTQYGMSQLGYYAPISFPLFPQSFFGYQELMPPTQFENESFSWQQPRPFIQQLEFASQTYQSVYSTAPASSSTIISTTVSQAEPTVPSQPSYNTPVTSQSL